MSEGSIKQSSGLQALLQSTAADSLQPGIDPLSFTNKVLSNRQELEKSEASLLALSEKFIELVKTCTADESPESKQTILEIQNLAGTAFELSSKRDEGLSNLPLEAIWALQTDRAISVIDFCKSTLSFKCMQLEQASVQIENQQANYEVAIKNLDACIEQSTDAENSVTEQKRKLNSAESQVSEGQEGTQIPILRRLHEADQRRSQYLVRLTASCNAIMFQESHKFEDLKKSAQEYAQAALLEVKQILEIFARDYTSSDFTNKDLDLLHSLLGVKAAPSENSDHVAPAIAREDDAASDASSRQRIRTNNVRKAARKALKS